MTDSINDGGAAFPSAYPAPTSTAQEGMSLRDYFAGKALQAILSHEKNILALALNNDGPQHLAADCYVMADAMLVARGSYARPEVPA